jgi:dihydrofolate reductase
MGAAVPSGHAFVAVSLDGYIAGKDGDISWLDKYAGQAEDHGYAAFMESVDGVVMGRGTFEKALSFPVWPHRDKTTVVMSGTLGPEGLRADLVGKVKISRLSPRELMNALVREGWRRVYVDGGRVIRSFLQDGLIADLVLTRIPVVLGGGIPLFEPDGRMIALEHAGTKIFPSGLVQSKYNIR